MSFPVNFPSRAVQTVPGVLLVFPLSVSKEVHSNIPGLGAQPALSTKVVNKKVDVLKYNCPSFVFIFGKTTFLR